MKLACDCGLARTGTLLICRHCDTGTCGGSCPRCATYKAGASRRLQQGAR